MTKCDIRCKSWTDGLHMVGHAPQSKDYIAPTIEGRVFNISQLLDDS